MVPNETVEPFRLLVQQLPWVAGGWIAFLGGSIGSFLNVVVYRLPRGMSLSTPSSHCPKCEHPIRWYDNLPVVGWLRLRGRCRDCGISISYRYPVIEALVAAIFVVLWGVEVVPFSTTVDQFAQAICLFVWHVTVMSVLVCIALIDFDRQSIPKSLFAFVFSVAGVILVAQQSLPKDWQMLTRERPFFGTLGVGVVDLLGLAATTFCGWVIFRFLLKGVGQGALPSPTWTYHGTAAVVGLTLGPERGALVMILSGLAVMLSRSVAAMNSQGQKDGWMRWAIVVAMFVSVGLLV